MTDVEQYSTARSEGRARLVPRALAILLIGVTSIAVAVPLSARPVAADSIASAKAQAAQLAQEIVQEGNRISALSEEYDLATYRLGQIDHQISLNRRAITQARQSVSRNTDNLRNQAIDEYMSGAPTTGLESLFASSGSTAPISQEYENLASGDIAGAIAGLHLAEQNLAVKRAALSRSEAEARATIAEIASSRRQAQVVEQRLSATLAQVRGHIAQLVAQQIAAERAAQLRAFEAKVAAERAAQARAAAAAAAAAAAEAAAQQQAQLQQEQQQQQQQQQQQGGGGQPPPPPPPPGGGSGAVALRAAESQLGVPYIWGGATPGVGFDCSGLTMWAWEQAGVSLPHSATLQWEMSTPVPLADLQPGDLLFYAEGGSTYIGHVTMYVAPGEMIQAMETGTNIQITPIWYTGLVGAGRP